MAVCCSCPCCETIRGHIGMLKSPCVMPAEHRDISVCRTMTLLSLLSQGISYPKAAKVTPCKCNMLSYWGLQAFITAVFFIRDMQQVSCDCIGYHHTYIPQHHSAPAFTAPAIPQSFHTLPRFDLPSYSIHVDRGIHSTFCDQANADALCAAANCSDDRLYP